ncbi:MAG: mannitol-1-phosphate 5-dehydrogenase [Clostridiales bacterium]|jgi:mannitol-1-phosphate 5-dehydrogenase|nr:mannitol-1-phosphate 5-dehydrogenase [Clostridiales bacterium]
MIAVHFGAGNIGRGFIGQLLNKSGYEVCFIDVNDNLIEALNQAKSYDIKIAGGKNETIHIDRVWGINSQTNFNALADVIKKCEIITVSVGVNILPYVAKTLAKALEIRLIATKKIVNIFACENVIGGSSILKKHVYEHLNSGQKLDCDKYCGFPNTAVDRIVPQQDCQDLLTVCVEPFYEWVINHSEVLGEHKKIEGATYVSDLTPFIERKLFTVNTGHCTIAYAGAFFGHDTITESINDSQVRTILEGVLSETGQLLIKKHNFDKVQHSRYIQKIVQRFANIEIADQVARVARQPIRKLGPSERFVKPAQEILNMGGNPINLAKIIAMTLLYMDKQDEESLKLQSFLKVNGIQQALLQFSWIEKNSPLAKLILGEYEKYKVQKKSHNR